MTVATVVTLVLLALALALQPWSVLAGILLVTTKRGVFKETLYVLGWILALSIVFALSVAVFPAKPGAQSSQPALHWGEIIFGAAIGLLLWVRWRRPAVTERAKEPKWLGRLDSMSPVVAFALGAFLPNYIVVVAAAGQVLQLKVTTAEIVLTGVLFVLLASVGVAAPLAVRIFRANDSAAIYANWRVWLIDHSRAVSYATGAVVALVLVIKGIVGLVT